MFKLYWIENIWNWLVALWHDYPIEFWSIFFGTLINAIGINIVFPFISLYLTIQLNFSMTEVGVIIAAFWVTSMVGQLISGGLVDNIGRKPVMTASLFTGSVTLALLGLVGPLLTEPSEYRTPIIAGLILLKGLSAGVFYPAVNSMTADLVSGEKRTRAYSLLRVVNNAGLAIGPAIGGFLASISYLDLFLSAGAAFIICGFIISFYTKETKPQHIVDTKLVGSDSISLIKTGFGAILTNRLFLLFNLLYFFSMLAYSQNNTTLPVYLQKYYGIGEHWYGLMMSLNAVMVVFLQYPVTHKLSKYDCGRMMAIGMAFFTIGFGLFGFVSTIPLFFLAQFLWTIGEMITTPVSQSYVADVAPENMRGRFMGFYGLSWGLAYGIGPLLGGMILDKLDGHFIWYASVLVNGSVTAAYFGLNDKLQISIQKIKEKLYNYK